MSRLIAFGDSFVVGDLDDFGPTDAPYYNPDFPPTHGMSFNDRLEYLKYNVSFASIIAKALDLELVNLAVRGSSNYAQLDILLEFVSDNKLQPDDIIFFGITTTIRDRRRVDGKPMWVKQNDGIEEHDLFIVLSVLDSLSKKYSVPIIKLNLFDNPLISNPCNLNFKFDNYLGWDLKSNTMSDIINDTWGQPTEIRALDYIKIQFRPRVKKAYEYLWTWNRHPSIEGHKKVADWLMNNVKYFQTKSLVQ